MLYLIGVPFPLHFLWVCVCVGEGGMQALAGAGFPRFAFGLYHRVIPVPKLAQLVLGHPDLVEMR